LAYDVGTPREGGILTTETNPEAAGGAATDSALPERAAPADGADDRTKEYMKEYIPGRSADGESGAGTGDDGDEGGEGYEGDESEEEDLDDDSAQAGLTRGIWWAAVLLPFLSVAGAILCFAAGVLNSGGCQPVGSALCSGSGQWFTFGLPLLISPLVAAVTAIGGVVVHRHRSTWLALGYFVVFVSILIGLASANSGGS
jgi:hypothetical protein